MDSGVGGLSVYQEIKQNIPNAQLHYFADHEASPYGEKEEQWLLTRICSCTEQLIDSIHPDIIVLACNTASTLALPALRELTSIPIIGVVPAIKTAASATRNNAIGVLATPVTVDSPYLTTLIDKFAANHSVTNVGSSLLVKMAEQKLSGIPVDGNELKTILSPLIESGCDSVVLGCTHFPLLKSELTELYPNINWIDSGKAIASRAVTVMRELNISKPTNNSIGEKYFYSSGKSLTPLRTHLSNLGFQDIQTIQV